MVFSKYTISFSVLGQEDIEMVRIWRNAPQVSSNLFTSASITPARQFEWYQSLGTSVNNYFLASYQGTPMGLFYITHIDFDLGQCESNGFIGIEEYRHTWVAGLAIIAFYEFLFLVKSFTIVTGRIVDGNQKFIDLHRNLGASIIEDAGHKNIVLTKEQFIERSGPYRKIAERLSC